MGHRKKILIVEDNEVFAALLSAALEDEFDVVVGHDGLQGISLCLEGGFSAVVTDIGMPEIDGIQMLQEFANNPTLSSIPVLVVTATHFTRQSKAEVANFPQVKRILLKTTSVDELASEVRTVLKEAEQSRNPA